MCFFSSLIRPIFRNGNVLLGGKANQISSGYTRSLHAIRIIIIIICIHETESNFRKRIAMLCAKLSKAVVSSSFLRIQIRD